MLGAVCAYLGFEPLVVCVKAYRGFPQAVRDCCILRGEELIGE